MFKPAPIKKASIILLEEDVERLLRALKETGYVQIIDVKTSVGTASKFVSPIVASSEYARISSLASRVRRLMESLRPLTKKGRGLLSLAHALEEAKKVRIKEEEALRFVENNIPKLESEVSKILEEYERINSWYEDVKRKLDILERVEKAGYPIGRLGVFEDRVTLVGLVQRSLTPDLEEELRRIGLEHKVIEYDARHDIVVVSGSKDKLPDIEDIISVYDIKRIDVPPEILETGSLEQAKARVEDDYSKRMENLRMIARERMNDLLVLDEILNIERKLVEAKMQMGRTGKTVLVQGWVPAKYVSKLEELVRNTLDGRYLMYVEDPRPGEEPPTFLEEPWLIKAAEIITFSYSIPRFREINPTPIVFFTFPLIYGLMFGDIGQGLVLFLAGLLVGFYLKGLPDIFRNFGRFLAACGFFAILGGFFYGEFFAMHTEDVFGLHPLLFNPLESPMSLFKLALLLGLAHLFVGCLLHIYVRWAEGRKLEAVLGPWGIPGIWAFFGGAYLIWSHSDNIMGMFADKPKFFLAVVVPFILLFIGKALEEIHHHKPISSALGWGFMEVFHTFLSVFSNGISYVRIMAIAVVHAVLNMLVETFAHSFSLKLGLLGFAGVMIFGNIFIIILEGFISFLQTLRLHYYEWFSKFFEGGGTLFEAFKVERRYTIPA